MSWSVMATGTAEQVINALRNQSTILTDQSREEFDDVLPHLEAIVKQNIGGSITLNAYGHGVKDAQGKYYDKSCNVNIIR